MAIRFLIVVCVFLLAACGGSSSSGGGGGVTPTTNINLDEGLVSALNEGQIYELEPAGGAVGGSTVVEWRWSNNPVNAGALRACEAVDGFNSQLAAQRLDAACTDATKCSIDFDQKESAEGETTFDLSIPELKASIGLTYKLTAVNEAQQTTEGNFTFCLIAINEAPSATNDVFIATEGVPLTVSASTGLNLLSNDTDDIDLSNKPLSVNPVPVTAPTLATEFTLQDDGGFTYLYVGAPDVPAGQTLTDSFGYEITDGFKQSTAVVTINIGTSDKPPRAIDAIPDQSVIAGVEKPFDLSTYFVDPENGELIFAAVRDTLPSGGNLSISELGVFAGKAGVDDVGKHVVRLTVSDQVSASEATNAPLEASFNLVVNPNQSPTVTAIENVEFEFGDLVSLDIAKYFSDAEAQPLSFSVVTEPSSTLQINEASGLLTGQLSVAGSYLVTVSADDGINSLVSQKFTIEQRPSPNRPPVLAQQQPDLATTVNVKMTPIAAAFTDPEGDALVYAINTVPAGLEFDAATGELSGTPTVLGNYNLRFSATDTEGASTLSNTFLLQVISLPNRPPAATGIIANQVLTLGESMSPANADFVDPDGDKLTYQISPALNGLPGYAFNFGTGTLVGTPANAGSTVFTITASDGTETVASNAFTITVNAPSNAPPVQGTAIADQAIVLGSSITLVNGGFTDADGDSLSYSISPPAGAGLSFSASTGSLSGTPSAAGSVDYTITASDGTATTASNEFTITVNTPANAAPIQGANIADQSIVQGNPIVLINGGFTDTDGDALSYSIAPPVAGSGLSFSPTNGNLSGVPTAVGSVDYTISASDGTAVTQSNEFTITVTAPQNAAPVAGAPIQNQVITLGQSITPINGGFTDDDPLTYSITPSIAGTGLAFNVATGTLSGEPLASGTLSFRIRATDGTLFELTNLFTIRVNEPAPVNVAPVQGSLIADQTVQFGSAINDINGAFTDTEILSYTLDPALPATSGMSFGAATGTLSGIPDGAGATTYNIIASDGSLSTESNAFTITVVAANQAPVIGPAASLGPQSVLVGTAIADVDGDFSDPDNDPMTFSIAPAASTAGLNFDPLTGVLGGQPDQPGTYSFVITASDGDLDTDTPAIEIEVTSPIIVPPPPPGSSSSRSA